MFTIVSQKKKTSKQTSNDFIDHFSTLSLEKKLEIANENNAVAQRLLGTYYYQQNKPEESIIWWKKSAENGDPIGLLQIAQYQVKELKQPALAKEYCEKALEKGKKSPDKMLKKHINDIVNENLRIISLSFFNNGIEKFKKNDKEGAKADWIEAANLNHPEAAFNLAKIFLEENNLDMAIYYIELTLYTAENSSNESALKDHSHHLFRSIYKIEKDIEQETKLLTP